MNTSQNMPQLKIITDSDGNLAFGTENSSGVPKRNTLRCHHNQLIDIRNLTKEELFSGFDTIQVITFSYDIPMIGWLMQRFKYAEVILGADFMVQKDNSTAAWAARILAANEDAAKRVGKCDSLVKNVLDGDLSLHTSVNILDHRKLYILKADNGKTRVITTSANMTRRAWSADQMENYAYDDTPAAYSAATEEFETAWNLSEDLPYETISAKETDEPAKINTIIREVKKTDKAVILQMPQVENEKEALENYNYVVDLKEASEKYQALVRNTGLKKKDGKIMFSPSVVQKILTNIKKSRIRKADIRDIQEGYPKLTIDYDKEAVLINGEPMDMHPSKDAVCADLNQIDFIFSNFEKFYCKDVRKQQGIYFKLMTALLASPFFARLRCDARLIYKSADSLPLFCLVSSAHASTGKTFFIQAVLKMMTGKPNLPVFSPKEAKPSYAAALQADGITGTPIFIDEIDGPYLSRLESAIKTPESICENRQNENIPMMVLASNNLTDPKEQLRKRMIFLNPEGTMPSDADQAAWKSAGKGIIGSLSTAFYAEYCRRMIPKVCGIIDSMETDSGKALSADWYPDLMKPSSETVIEILNDFGYDKPDFVRVLTWMDDFSENAPSVAADALDGIRDLYRTDRKAFKIKKDTVTIVLGSGSRKMIESWAAVLPSEIMDKVLYTREGCSLIMNRGPLEKALGIRFRKRLW